VRRKAREKGFMIYNITINCSIDTNDYNDVSSENDVKALVQAMWEGETDLPETFEMNVEEAQ
jgi:hypothetical protein